MINKTVLIIPARFGSSRYRGKPLVKILGRELVLRVADVCAKTVGRENLYIATDSIKIKKRVQKENFKSIMTSSRCLTGTDRVAEASKKLKAKIFVNVQGDEPLVHPKDIRAVINAKKKFPKVVVNSQKELIYISRSLIPGSKKTIKNKNYFKQVCIYAFNKKELNSFFSLKKKSEIEEMEDIEILRFFDLGIKIKMIKLNSNSVAVDEIRDVKKAEKILISRKKL